MQEVLGGDASAQYNDNSMATMSGMGGMDTMSSYGASDGSLRTYRPHGIALSSDPNTLYVVDYANGELVVVDKNGNAPYNYLVGTTAQGSFGGSSSMGGMNMTSGGMMTGTSPASLKANGETAGGGPGTYYVRYRIPVGDSPDFIQVINGKIFITLQGSNSIAVIDESAIINEINADNAYYGTRNADGSFTNWNTSMMMRTVNQPTVRMVMGIGSQPSFMKTDSMGMNLYVSVSGDNQIAVVDTNMEMVTKTINVGTNPKGFDITPDGKYLYVANYGGVGDLSFIYPQGTYIGDPFMALEGGIMYQGADGWTPDRSDWVYDASGNIQSKATVEFHINEPLKNEGGYAKLTAFGIDTQYAQIEQDIINVENYSNGNNVVVVTGGRLVGNFDSSVWTPREGSFISGTVHNVMIGSIFSGNVVLTSANASQYSVDYNYSQVIVSSNAMGSGNWIQADYTAPNNIYFKTHNSSVEIAVDNGSSPNFDTSFQVDEFVPNFVAVDNRQTSSFTPTSDGISDTYEGLEYSVMTNRALNIPSGNITTNGNRPTGSGTANISRIVDGDTTSTQYYDAGTVSGGAYMKLDLGNIYMIGQINVWHYYSDARTYHKTKTEVSEDGINWTTVFDSAVSGEYVETSSGNVITFNAKPTRYIRDWASGNTVNTGNHWVEIQAFGDWQVEKGYTYPSNSTKAGQQIATNGIGFVSTDIPKAYVAMNVQINFTSWWWMTYIVGPDFGRIKIEMPTLMNSGHYLNQQSPFVNNVAHRHIMSFPPSMMVQQDDMNGIEGGKHRVIIRQDSGKVTLDRLRFDDYQFYNRSTLAIPSESPATFTRYKVIAEQAKWYQGKGRQTTEGAYDTPRTNPDTGLQDYSVPIKYRVRVLSQLSPVGSTQERGTIYVTSAIFETGKQSTHWRRSEASDVYAGNKIQTWDSNNPMSTGIQSAHLADGAVRSSKILPSAVYDYHISNYARIQEHKLELNYPTHDHTNKAFLDTMTGFAGTSGNYGTGNTVARGDHKHDYLPLSGGVTVTGNTTFNNGITSKIESHFSNGTYADPANGQAFGLKVSQGIATDKLNVNGNVTVTGNITITGTIDSVDVSTLSGNVASLSGTVYGHIGSGGSAHALVTSGSAGFMSSTDKIKLDAIQSSSINQATADARYAQISGGNLNNTTLGKILEHERNTLILGNNDWTPLLYSTVGGTVPTNFYYSSTNKGVTFSGVSVWAKVRTRLPIDPESTYFVRAKVTKNSGSGGVYIGVDTLDNNYNSLSTDQAQSYNYFGASNAIIPSGSSQYFEATISGYNATTGSNPHMFDPSGNYFDLVLIGNYQGSGTTTFEWIELYKAPNTAYVGANTVIHSGLLNVSTLNGHIGSGGSAHAVATSSNAGFMSPSDKAKLDSIQSSSINQTTTDSLYLNLTGGALSGGLSVTGNIAITGTVDGVDVSVLNSSYITTSGNVSNHIGSGGSAHPIAISGGSAGFIDGTNYAKLLNIQSNAINQTTTDSRYLQLTGGALSGNLTVTGNISVTGTVDGVDISALNSSYATTSANVTNHIGSGGSAHAVAISGGANGFIDGANYGKLLRIQDNAINQVTADSRYLQLTGGVLSGGLTITGNITITGTVDGVDVSALNSSFSTVSGNVTNHIGSGGSAHAVAVSGGSNGFIDGANYGKLLRIQDNAINQTTADGRYYIINQSVKVSTDNVFIGADTGAQRMGIYKKAGYSPVMAVTSGGSFSVYEMNTSDLSTNISGTSLINNLLTVNSSDIQYKSNSIWHKGTLADPATQTWISGNYYNSSTVDTKLLAKGDVFLANANSFTNTNTFTNAGLGIKIQPSGSVANTTKLMQVNTTTGTEIFSINYSGGVTVAGDLTVTGQTKYAGTTQVNGDYSISGNMFVSGNTTLGNVSTDTTTVNGTLIVNGNIQEVGYYQEVHRRPLFGIAGDLQFQTNSTTFDQIVDFYDLSAYANPTVQTGATRYYRLYAVYSDDITSAQASGGQQSTIRISGNTTKDIALTRTWGSVNARRDFYSPYFTDLPTGNGNLYAMLAQSGNNLGIRWIELIAYDKF
jgi:YVTN family beta-propeller protein